jgi:hypothetical protein
VQVVLGYLDKRVATGVASSRGEEWAPLHMYRYYTAKPRIKNLKNHWD